MLNTGRPFDELFMQRMINYSGSVYDVETKSGYDWNKYWVEAHEEKHQYKLDIMSSEAKEKWDHWVKYFEALDDNKGLEAMYYP